MPKATNKGLKEKVLLLYLTVWNASRQMQFQTHAT